MMECAFCGEPAAIEYDLATCLSDACCAEAESERHGELAFEMMHDG